MENKIKVGPNRIFLVLPFFTPSNGKRRRGKRGFSAINEHCSSDDTRGNYSGFDERKRLFPKGRIQFWGVDFSFEFLFPGYLRHETAVYLARVEPYVYVLVLDYLILL